MTVTPDKPDWQGYVTNAPDMHLVATIVNQAPNTPNVLALNPSTRFLVVMGGATTEALSSCIGATTGTEYAVFATTNPGINFSSFVIIPVFAAVDTVVTLKLTGPGNINAWVVEMPDAPVIGTQQFPTVTAPFQQGYLPNRVSNAAGSTALLAAPGVGAGYLVAYTQLSGDVTAVAGQSASLRGSASGIIYHQITSGTAGNRDSVITWGGALINEGLNLVNSTGASIAGLALAALVDVFV